MVREVTSKELKEFMGPRTPVLVLICFKDPSQELEHINNILFSLESEFNTVLFLKHYGEIDKSLLQTPTIQCLPKIVIYVKGHRRIMMSHPDFSKLHSLIERILKDEDHFPRYI